MWASLPLIVVVDEDIIVATKNGNLLVLDKALNAQNHYKPIDDMPLCLAATFDFIAVGTTGNKVIFYDRHGSTEPTVRIKLRNEF